MVEKQMQLVFINKNSKVLLSKHAVSKVKVH